MALREAVLPQGLEDVLGQLQKPELVRHGALASAQPPGAVLLAQAVHPHEVRHAPRLLEEVQVLPLQVFHHRKQARLLHIHVQHDAGHLPEPGEARRAKPPLARHQLVAPEVQPHGQRRNHAVLRYARRELRERGLVKFPPRLVRVGIYLVDRQLNYPGAAQPGPCKYRLHKRSPFRFRHNYSPVRGKNPAKKGRPERALHPSRPARRIPLRPLPLWA